MGYPMTKKELATVAGYSYRQLYNIDRDLPEGRKLFVKSEEGKYDLAIFVQKWVAYNISREASDDADIDTIKARHEKAKAEKTEIEVEKLKGQLVDVGEVKRLWGEIANSVMQNLIHLPSKLAPMLTMMDNTDVIADIIDREIRTVLEALSETPLPEGAAVQQDEETDEDE